MPNIKSAAKRVLISAEDRRRNRSEKAQVATCRRTFLAVVSSKDKDKCMQAFRTFCSALDKAAKKGILKANTARRSKSRASAQLAKALA